MPYHDDKRRKLLGRLSRQVAYTAPALALVAGGLALQGTASPALGLEPIAEETLLLASDQFGMDQVHADEMVQVCMVAPMEAEPLEWGSEELTSLSALNRTSCSVPT